MAIVIKEVIIKTTVEQKATQWLQPSEEAMKKLKQEILAELAENSGTWSAKKDRKNR